MALTTMPSVDERGERTLCSADANYPVFALCACVTSGTTRVKTTETLPRRRFLEANPVSDSEPTLKPSRLLECGLELAHGRRQEGLFA